MKIAVIGAGAMGGAIAEGFVHSGRFLPSDITVSAPHESTLERFAALGIRTTTDNRHAAEGADVVIVAVKPWLVENVISGIKPMLDYSTQTVVSVAAGVSGDRLTAMLAKEDGSRPETFIAIPNIAISVGCSMTFIVAVNGDATATEKIEDMFNSVGSSLIVDEHLLGAGTALASCGIAYAMRYVRAASEGGVELGFKAGAARDIVLQTVKGAVALLQANGNHPEAEIDKVTTPGGLTIRGLNEMERAGFTNAVIRGLVGSK